jgi:small subunit ribosomal protein S17e
MGRIKTTFVKNIAKDLIEKYPESFSKTFEENKKALVPFISFTSRKMRNLVAGYITSVKNAKPFVRNIRAEERPKDADFGRRVGMRKTGTRRRR